MLWWKGKDMIWELKWLIRYFEETITSLMQRFEGLVTNSNIISRMSTLQETPILPLRQFFRKKRSSTPSFVNYFSHISLVIACIISLLFSFTLFLGTVPGFGYGGYISIGLRLTSTYLPLFCYVPSHRSFESSLQYSGGSEG